MIQEIASIHVREGQEALFEAGGPKPGPLFLRARGRHDMQLYRSIEQPQRYTLVVDWETVENHMVDFPRIHRFPGMAQARGRLLRRAAPGASRAESPVAPSPLRADRHTCARCRETIRRILQRVLAILAETAPAMSMSS